MSVISIGLFPEDSKQGVKASVLEFDESIYALKHSEVRVRLTCFLRCLTGSLTRFYILVNENAVEIEDKSKLDLQKNYLDFLSEVYQKHLTKLDEDKVYDEQIGTYVVNSADIKVEKLCKDPSITLFRIFLRTPIKNDEITSIQIQFVIQKFVKSMTRISIFKFATFGVYNFNKYGLEEHVRERLSELEHSELPIQSGSVCMAAPRGQIIVDEEPQIVRRTTYTMPHPGHPDLKLKGCQQDQWRLDNLISREKPAKFELKFQPAWSIDLGTIAFLLSVTGLTLTLLKLFILK